MSKRLGGGEGKVAYIGKISCSLRKQVHVVLRDWYQIQKELSGQNGQCLIGHARLMLF